MSRFCTLASSSRGNCSYLSGAGASLLVDAGLSWKAIRQGLSGVDARAEELSGVFITHEHTDHVKGLSTLLKHLSIPVYASGATLSALVDMGLIPPGATMIELAQEAEVAGIGVRSFELPHDAAGPLGYRFSLPDGRSVGVATDLGHVTQRVRDALTGCDLILLESNYDPAMLRAGPYPWVVKRRVAGDQGHLSNEASSRLSAHLTAHGTTRLILGHLSVNNNYPDIAYLTTRSALDSAGAQEGRDYLLSVAPAFVPHPLVIF